MSAITLARTRANYSWNYDRLSRTSRRRGINMQSSHLSGTVWKEVETDFKFIYYERAGSVWYEANENPLTSRYAHILISHEDAFKSDIEDIIPESILKADSIRFAPTLRKRIRTNRAYYNMSMSAKALQGYLKNKRTQGITIVDEVKKLIKEWARLYNQGLRSVMDYNGDDEVEVLLTYLAPRKNCGYPLFIGQTKDNFPELWEYVTSRAFGQKIPFNVSGIIKAINMLFEKMSVYALVYILFYRTKDEDEARAVFGGNVLLKGIGCLIKWAKSFIKDKVPKIGNLPCMSIEDWDTLFPKFGKLKFNRPLFGEDIIKFDNNVIYEDLSWIENTDGLIGKIWTIILHSMRDSKVLFGHHKVEGVFFVSGHPLTSEFGSFVHLALIYGVAKAYGVTLLNAIVQSDDSVTNYSDGMLFDYIIEYGDQEGFPIKSLNAGSYSYEEHNVVGFLRNWIYHNDSGFIFHGDPASRYGNAIQRETGSPELFYVFVNDDQANMFVAQFGSLTSNLKVPVYNVLKAFEADTYGKTLLEKIRGADLDAVSFSRPDLNVVGFKPNWLVEAIIAQDYI